MQMKEQVLLGAERSVPAAALVGAQLYGLSLPEWAAIAGIAFIALQAAYLVWQWVAQVKRRNKEKQDELE
jgi:membrane protein implicated in regulation of membrane protease activity